MPFPHKRPHCHPQCHPQCPPPCHPHCHPHPPHTSPFPQDVTTEPCGSIRRMNVEIPALSVSDMKRLKSLDCVGTFTLFQETYHRPTFEQMHLAGPKVRGE